MNFRVNGSLPKQLHPDRMSKEDFVLEVQKVVRPEDFGRYNDRLIKIKPRFYRRFILLMISNFPMNLNLTILDLIEDIQQETGLIDEDILRIFPKYALILMMLQGN